MPFGAEIEARFSSRQAGGNFLFVTPSCSSIGWGQAFHMGSAQRGPSLFPRPVEARLRGHDGRDLSRGLVQPPFPVLTNPGNRYKIRSPVTQSRPAPFRPENTVMCLFVYIPQGLWRVIVLYQYVNLFEPASNRVKTGPNRLKTGLNRAFAGRLAGLAGAVGRGTGRLTNPRRRAKPGSEGST